MSDSKDKSPLGLKSPLTPKKSLFSSISSKLKSKSVQQTSAPTHANHKGSSYVAPIPIQQAPDQKPRPLVRSSSAKEKASPLARVLSNRARSTSQGATSAPVKSPPMPTASKVSSTATSSTLESYNLTPTSSLHQDPVDRLTRVPFKRVVFALDTLTDEPQQQIPSRVPKKGDVIIPEDLNAPPPRLTMGIHTTPPPSSETNSADTAPVDPQAAKLAEERLMREAIERQKMSLIQSRKHANEAHAAAVRIAKEVANYKKSKNSKNKEEEDQEEEEEKANWEMQNHSFADFSGGDIDTPLHEHVDYFNNGNDQESSKWDNQEDDVIEDLPLDQLYTQDQAIECFENVESKTNFD
ncbi:unnamed protein product [Ambrosiozyma monospora]|uniref:Unnamed protein product n=1 Tax=Ambrosiozyma monospora TaxID=43982 RepID=A0ACB5U4N0_AMBMO|nr:unnamed protein product [Ambrosiozyma monospora]